MSDNPPPLNNPFDLSAPGGNVPGLAGQTPDFWKSLALFGGNLAAGANARTGQGFLANGPGLAGPLGAAIAPTMAATTQAAALRSNLANQGAETQARQLQNIGLASGLPIQIASNQMMVRALTDPSYLQNLRQMMMGGGAQTPGAASASPGAPSTAASGADTGPSAYSQAVIKGEGVPTKSGTSSANGYGQFIDGTWQQFATENPQYFQGMTPQQIMASRADPNIGPGLAAHATDWLARKNAQPLAAAGAPVNGATLAMAHYITPQGAAAVAAAPPDALVGGVLGQAVGPKAAAQFIGANPSLATTTAGQMRARYAQVPDPPFAGGATAPQGTSNGSLTPLSDQTLAQANQLESLQKLPMGQFMFPGDPAALRTKAQQERAYELSGPTEAAKSANTITMDRYGNRYQGNTYLGRGSEVEHVWNPATGQMEWGDVGAVGPDRQPIPMGTQGPNGAATSGQAAAPTPMQAEFQKKRGEDLAEQFTKVDNDAAAAKDSNYLFDNMRNDAQSWDMGKFADIEGDARAYLSAISHAFGVTSPDLDKPLADYQAFNKSSGMLLRAAVHDTSSRAAVQEYRLIGDSLPQPTTSAQGFGQVADQWQGLNDFRLAKQKFAQNYQGNPQQFNMDFNSKVSPTSFMFNRMSQTPQGQQDMQSLLATMQKTPEGRMAAGRILSQYRYSKQAGLFDDLPPIGSNADPSMSAVQHTEAAPTPAVQQ